MCLLQLFLLVHYDIKHSRLLLLQVLHLEVLLAAVLAALLIVVVAALGGFNRSEGSLC